MPVFLDDYLVGTRPAGGIRFAGCRWCGAHQAVLEAMGRACHHRRRERPTSEVMHLIGDVQGKDCIIIDDMIDTAGTLCNAAKAVMDNGARRVVACATHGVLSGPAIQRIIESPLDEVVVSDTIPLSETAKACPKIKQIGMARLLGEAIKRIHSSDSVSSLFS
jgi:ribose-phosphate pyrophosphokinase